MHKFIRPNLIHKVSRSAPAAAQPTSFVAFNNIQMLQPAVDVSTNPDGLFPYSVCICTLLKNNQKDFEVVVSNIRGFQRMFKKSFVVFVDCGSSDNTVETFSKLDNVLFIRMEKTSTEAECRNAYLSFVKKNANLFDVMAVADVNIALRAPISSESLSLFSAKTAKWDVAFANQSYRYYDIKNLRSAECPDDLSKLTDEERGIRMRTLRRHIPRDEKPIQVHSAFGGLAFYKTDVLNGCDYANDGHVSLNLKVRGKTPNMFIYPSLVLETLEANVGLYL